MGDDIGSDLLSMAVYFDFRSSNVVQVSNQNLSFYQFGCHHPLITQLSVPGGCRQLYHTTTPEKQTHVSDYRVAFKNKRMKLLYQRTQLKLNVILIVTVLILKIPCAQLVGNANVWKDFCLHMMATIQQRFEINLLFYATN